MANTLSHLRQWKHNRAFIPRIPSHYTDWIVTVTFYPALHVVDALLAFDKTPGIVSHSSRNEVLFKTNKYLKISRLYIPLFDLSHIVRYLADPISWVPFEQVEIAVFARYLYPIEESVRKQLLDRNPGLESELSVPKIVFPVGSS